VSAVAIVDSGANYASVCGALERLGASYFVTSDADELRAAERVILPGVGDVGDTWRRLEEHGLPDVLRTLTQPLLGICVGMQVMFEYCEEANIDGLGIFAGAVTKLPLAAGIRVPHCGWNQLEVANACALTSGIGDGEMPYAYFVHSYAAAPGAHTVAVCNHGTPFSAIVARDNVYGVQFHPERSAETGRALLAAFLAA